MSDQTLVSFSDGYNNELRPLLDKYDKIRHHLENDEELQTTSIVVIGDQSSGKSSVLESLVQIGLPRGENMVTRMPIILQCRCIRPGSGEKPHAKVSINSPNNDRSFEVNDLSHLEETIRKCQEKVMKDEGKVAIDGMDESNRISETPIYVQIVKEGIPDVTLTDLPGMNYATRELKERITALCEKYIRSPRAVILNVISAATDVVTSESLLFAKTVDPEEKRTIYVLTKVDRCARNEVLAKFRRFKATKSRFVFVRNRNPDEIKENISWNEIRQKEKVFLADFTEVEKTSKGVPALGAILVEEGRRMILQSVDQLLDDVPQILRRLNEELATLGESYTTAMEKKSYFDKISHRMTPRIQQLLNGSSNADDPDSLLLNSNIQKFLKTFEEKFEIGSDMIFTAEFRDQVQKSLDATEGLTLPNFLSNPVFSTLLNRLMKHSGVYKAITHDVILGDTEGDPGSGIIPYINSVIDVLIHEALRGRTIDERFGRNLSCTVKQRIRKIGEEFADSLTQLVDAELEAGPFTTDSRYMKNVRKIELFEEMIKKEREGNAAGVLSAATEIPDVGAHHSDPFRWSRGEGNNSRVPQPASSHVTPNSTSIQSTSSVFNLSSALTESATTPTLSGPKTAKLKRSREDRESYGKKPRKSISFGEDLSEIYHLLEGNDYELSVRNMQTSLYFCWKIVRIRLRDHAHLLVMFSLCGKLRKWEELMDSLWQENSDLYLRLLVENRDVAHRRKQLQNRIQKLGEASEVLNSMPLDS